MDLTVLFLLTRSRISLQTGGHPGLFDRLLNRQNSLKPFLCHLITVAGSTMIKTFVQSPQKRDNKTQKSRSLLRLLGFMLPCFKTASCCRRAMFSKARLDMMLSLDRITESSFHSLFIMAGDCGRFAEKCQ